MQSAIDRQELEGLNKRMLQAAARISACEVHELFMYDLRDLEAYANVKELHCRA
jgi:hypothetical protein